MTSPSERAAVLAAALIWLVMLVYPVAYLVTRPGGGDPLARRSSVLLILLASGHAARRLPGVWGRRGVTRDTGART